MPTKKQPPREPMNRDEWIFQFVDAAVRLVERHDTPRRHARSVALDAIDRRIC